MTYTIDYNTGVTEDVAGTLEEAMAVADDGAAYTQQPITITDEAGNTVARRPWCGLAYNPAEVEDSEDEIIGFGNYGYYGAWDNTIIPANNQPDYANIWYD